RKHHFVIDRLDLVKPELVEVGSRSVNGVTAQTAGQEDPRTGLLEANQIDPLGPRKSSYVSDRGQNIVHAIGQEGPVIAERETGILRVDYGWLRSLKLAGHEHIHREDSGLLIQKPARCRNQLAVFHDTGFAGRMNPEDYRAITIPAL